MFTTILKYSATAVMIAWGALGAAQGIESVAPSTSAPTELGVVRSVLGDRKIPPTTSVEMTSGTYAIFHTSEGDFIAELAPKVAPATVQNFIGYATGKKSWRHPVTMVETHQPLFSNRMIYRIVPNGMIYSGDPLDRGEADSGTQLTLESSPAVQFNQPGLLAMDSSGDQMSGSRWFITLRPFPDRNGKYTIFGKVIGGLDLVQRISNKPVQRPQMPLDPVMIQFVEIVKIPAGRVTTGTFVDDGGLKRLRIDPNFKDAPMGQDLPDIFALNDKKPGEEDDDDTSSPAPAAVPGVIPQGMGTLQ